MEKVDSSDSLISGLFVNTIEWDGVQYLFKKIPLYSLRQLRTGEIFSKSWRIPVCICHLDVIKHMEYIQGEKPKERPA